MKNKFFFTILIGLVGCTSQKASIKTNSQDLIIKNYAFCRCISTIYPDFNNQLRDGSIAKYSFELDNVEAIDTLVNQWIVKNQYRSIQDNNLGLQRCLDFYNSQGIDSLVNVMKK
ncbi:MAG: hypothetical protein U5L45_16275 [Saprospiraceae bacterium]|nr:hypothetical protein [Saprospiraceae bacterium]